MMDAYSKEQLSKYRLERAKEALDEAELLAQQEHWNTAASRLYYACFYAASAYLVLKEVTASTHSGIKIAFNKALISTSVTKRSFLAVYFSNAYIARRLRNFPDMPLLNNLKNTS